MGHVAGLLVGLFFIITVCCLIACMAIPLCIWRQPADILTEIKVLEGIVISPNGETSWAFRDDDARPTLRARVVDYLCKT